MYFVLLSPLTHDKILDCMKLKSFADDNSYVAQIVQSSSDRVENFVGKGENAGYLHNLLLPQYF